MQVFSLNSFENFIPVRKTFALFGTSAAFSLSPCLHNELFKLSGIDAEYISVTVSPDELERAVELAKEKLCGFNCTIPHKQAIIPFLSDMDKHTELLGAANTVTVKNGKLYGYNTDGIGFTNALKQDNVDVSGKDVLLLGYGGAALSVGYELAVNGAKKITVAGRSRDKAQSFIKTLSQATERDIFEFAELENVSGWFDILVNTTPVGMSDEGVSPVDLDKLNGLTFVYDCIYHPPMTKLLRDANAHQIPWDNGLSMLIGQGAQAQVHWLDIPPHSAELIKHTLDFTSAVDTKNRLKTIYKKGNIALSGFMGSGKTTIGKALARLLDMDFIDLDEYIEKTNNITIPEIFEKFGEKHFRALESRACSEISCLDNTVISTGGGTVINNNNADTLRENAIIIYLNRTIEQIQRNLQNSFQRPLLSGDDNASKLRELYNSRKELYEKHTDINVTFPNGIDDGTKHVIMHI